MKNYHSILGVSPHASKDEIKKAYRKLAREHHPDHGGDEEKFKEINEAYNALTNPSTTDPFAGMNQSYSGDDIFDAMFNDVFSQFGFNGRRTSSHQVNLDIDVSINLSLKEVYKGTSKNISFDRETACRDCNGLGFKSKVCPTCDGMGTKTIKQNNVIFQSSCSSCRGKGFIKVEKDKGIPTTCLSCSGKGKYNQQVSETIEFPPGAGNLNQMVQYTIPGKGNTSSRGRMGNLNVFITTTSDNKFKQEGLNLIYSTSVRFSDLCLGSKVEVELPDESKIQVKIPSGTDLYKMQRVRGKGMPQVRSPAKGDLLVNFTLKIPKNLTSEQKDLLEKLRACEL